MRKSFYVVLALLLAVMVAGIVFILMNLKHITCSLFDFSIIDVMSLLTSVIIGFGLTYLVSVSFSKESKKNEIIEESLTAIKDDFAYIMQQFMKLRNNMVTDNFRSFMLLVLKNVDKDIAILMRLCAKRNNMKQPVKALIKQRSDFNYLATGDNLTTGQVLSDTFIEECSKKYYLIKQTISQCKVELYSV